jgi:hypothetical protein
MVKAYIPIPYVLATIYCSSPENSLNRHTSFSGLVVKSIVAIVAISMGPVFDSRLKQVFFLASLDELYNSVIGVLFYSLSGLDYVHPEILLLPRK